MVVAVEKDRTYRVRVRNRTSSQGRVLTDREKSINGLEFYVKCLGFLDTLRSDEAPPSEAAFDVMYYDPNFRIFAASGTTWLLAEDVEVIKEISADK